MDSGAFDGGIDWLGSCQRYHGPVINQGWSLFITRCFLPLEYRQAMRQPYSQSKKHN